VSGAGARLVLARWTLTTGSNTQSRAAVVIERGEQLWQASADGNGAVSALFHAVDRALADVLDGHVRLVAYAVTAMGEGPDAEGRVELEILPPGESSAAAEAAVAAATAGQGATSHGSGQGPNIVAASVEAYVAALNVMLGSAVPAIAGGDDQGARRRTQAATSDVVFEEAAEAEPINWFEP